MSKDKTIKAFMRKNSGYALYDSDYNVLIGVIQCSTNDESKIVDITKKVKRMIKEHFSADSVKPHSLPIIVLHPDMTTQTFSASMVEDGEETDRPFEICTVAIY